MTKQFVINKITYFYDTNYENKPIGFKLTDGVYKIGPIFIFRTIERSLREGWFLQTSGTIIGGHIQIHFTDLIAHSEIIRDAIEHAKGAEFFIKEIFVEMTEDRSAFRATVYAGCDPVFRKILDIMEIERPKTDETGQLMRKPVKKAIIHREIEGKISA